MKQTILARAKAGAAVPMVRKMFWPVRLPNKKKLPAKHPGLFLTPGFLIRINCQIPKVLICW